MITVILNAVKNLNPREMPRRFTSHVAGHKRNTQYATIFGGVKVSTGVVEAVAASGGPSGTIKSWKIKFKR